jgi:very-short-patch-repair endonuclease
VNRRIRASDVNPAVLAAAGVDADTEKLSRAKIIAQRFADQVAERSLPEPVRELAFAADLGRRWRFDFAWPDHRVALEIEGLVVMRVNGELQVKGRHASITGFKDDCEKYAWAAVLGWRVLRFEQSQVKSRFAIDMLVRVLAGITPTKQTACAAKPEKTRGEGVTQPLPLDFGAPF